MNGQDIVRRIQKLLPPSEALLEFVRQTFTDPAEAVNLAYLAGVFFVGAIQQV
jgi:hypothetical protein